MFDHYRVRQHRRYTCKSSLVMIFDIYVTCGGVILFDGLGPLFESYTGSTACCSTCISLQERIHERVMFSFFIW